MAIHHQVSFIAYLAADPQLRYTPGGQPVLSLRFPVNNRYTRDGVEYRETTWYSVGLFGEQAEKVEKRNYQKGDLIFVQGQPLPPRTYQRKDGGIGCDIGLRFVQMTRVSGKTGDGDFEAAHAEALATDAPAEAAPALASAPSAQNMPTAPAKPLAQPSARGVVQPVPEPDDDVPF